MTQHECVVWHFFHVLQSYQLVLQGDLLFDPKSKEIHWGSQCAIAAQFVISFNMCTCPNQYKSKHKSTVLAPSFPPQHLLQCVLWGIQAFVHPG